MIKHGADDGESQLEGAMNGLFLADGGRPANRGKCRLGCVPAVDKRGRLCWSVDIEYYAVAKRIFDKLAAVELTDSSGGVRVVHVRRRSDCNRIEFIEKCIELMASNRSFVDAQNKDESGNPLRRIVPGYEFAVAAILGRHFSRQS